MKDNPSKGLLLVGVGTQLSAMIISGFLIGFVVDKWLGTMPVFLLIIGLLGFVGGFLKAHKLLTRLK